VTTFRRATRADDALVRAILREHGTATWVEMAIAREPSFFSGGNPIGEEWAVIGEEAAEIVGMYTAAIVPVYVDGRAERIGYLGGLRVVPRHRRRIRHLREGYASIRPLAPSGGTLPWWFTVVAADNAVARRLLEAGVAGLPAYEPLGEYVTFGLATARGRPHDLWRSCSATDVPQIVAFHRAHASRFDLAPILDETVVLGIGPERFFIHERDGETRGLAALWDQRAFKQIVARRYRRPIGALVPAYNLYAKLFRRIPLPREGRLLEHTFIAFLALADDVLTEAPVLLEDLLRRCATPVASLGLQAAHPLVSALAELAPMRYPARVYAVSFEQPGPATRRPAQPEAALL
jgi:hypothetical protein